MDISSQIKFGDENLKKAYLELDSNRFQEKQLKEWLDRAMEDIEKNAFCGIQLAKKLIPKEYPPKYGSIDNLWKYNLPNAWRLIYTIKKEGIVVFSIVLEWLPHKDYGKRFGY